MKIAVLVTGRHDEGLLGPTMSALDCSEDVELDVIVGELHGTQEAYISQNLLGEFPFIAKMDWLVVLGDRVETFTAALTARLAGVKIAHIHGGELSGEMLMDPFYRDMITRMADVHFPCTEKAKKRVFNICGCPGKLTLREDDFTLESYIHRISAPCMTKIRRIVEMPGAEHHPSKCGQCGGVVHMTTTEYPDGTESIKPTCMKCRVDWGENCEPSEPFKSKSRHCVVTYHGGDLAPILAAMPITIRPFVSKGNSDKGVPPEYNYHVSETHEDYLELLHTARFCIGNSSSFVIEAPALRTPTILVGDRQEGRAQSPSIFQVAEDEREIISAIDAALKYDGEYVNAWDGGPDLQDIIVDVLNEF